MSADNWAICPKCKIKSDKTAARTLAKVNAEYGKTPPDEWIIAFNEAKNPPEIEQTLREDYRIGIGEAGLFDVDYKARCTKCGFEFTYDHEQQLQKEIK